MRTCQGCQFYQPTDKGMKQVCNPSLRRRYGCAMFQEPYDIRDGKHVIVYGKEKK